MGNCQSVRLHDAIFHGLKESFLGPCMEDADLKKLASKFTPVYSRVLKLFNFKAHVFGVVTSGTLVFKIQSSGAVLREYGPGDFIPFFLMNDITSLLLKGRVQFVGGKDSKNKSLKVHGLSCRDWESFLKVSPDLSSMSTLVTMTNLMKTHSLSKLDPVSTFVFGLLLNTAGYKVGEKLLSSTGKCASPCADCAGLLLNGRLFISNPERDQKAASMKTTMEPLMSQKLAKTMVPLNDEEVRVEVDTRNPSDLFTLDRVLMDSPLCYDDIAVTETCVVGWLTRPCVVLIKKSFPDLYHALKIELNLQLMVNISPHVHILRDLKDEALVSMSHSSTVLNCNDGDTLCFAGDSAVAGETSDSVFLILRGSVAISCKDKEANALVTKNYNALPEGGYSVVCDLPVIADLSECMYTVTITGHATVLLQIPGPVYREFCGTFNTTVSNEAEKNLSMAGQHCTLHDILFCKRGYDEMFKFIGKEVALENIYFWKAVTIYQDVLLRIEKIYAEEFFSYFFRLKNFRSRSVVTNNLFMTKDPRFESTPTSARNTGYVSSLAYSNGLSDYSSRQRRTYDELKNNTSKNSTSVVGFKDDIPDTGDDSVRTVHGYNSHRKRASKRESVNNSKEKMEMQKEKNVLLPSKSVDVYEDSGRIDMSPHMMLLRSLGQKLVENFLLVNSENEVNISGKVRNRLLEILADFIPSSDMFNSMMKVKYGEDDSTLPTMPIGAAPSGEKSSINVYGTLSHELNKADLADMKNWQAHTDMLSIALMEVLAMIDKGPFHRWKLTREFQDFVAHNNSEWRLMGMLIEYKLKVHTAVVINRLVSQD